MFQSTKNKLLYIAFGLWALLFFSLAVIKILTLFQSNSSLKTSTNVFLILEVIALWMLLLSVTWTLVSKIENIKKLTNLSLLLILFVYIIISLVNLMINNQILKLITQLNLVLVVAAVTINLLSNKIDQKELLKDILLISLKVAWAIFSVLVVIYKDSIALHICNLIVTLTMVPLSVYFISLKNINVKNNDLLSPMLQDM